jgi:hypothetical protein
LNILIISTIISFSASDLCNAEDSNYKISIKEEPTYKLTNTIERNGAVFGKSYKIDIIFTNSGNQKSDEIEVNLSDEEGFVLSQKTYFNAGQTKTITFNWSTILIKNQKLKLNYYPSNLGTPRNKYNSGQEIINIKINDNSLPGTSTPGFEIALMIIAIIFAILSYKRKR